jgi:hypothetical protein
MGGTHEGDGTRTRRRLVVPLLFLATFAAPLPLHADGPVPTPRAPSDGRLAEARSLVRGGKVADARKVLGSVLEADPKNRDARKALLEAAALMKDWNECNAQTALLEPFTDGEETSMFYAAVALRETGSVASARALVRRARPFLVPSSFVDWYTKDILGN